MGTPVLLYMYGVLYELCTVGWEPKCLWVGTPVLVYMYCILYELCTVGWEPKYLWVHLYSSI